jgi:hypothetical protein
VALSSLVVELFESDQREAKMSRRNGWIESDCTAERLRGGVEIARLFGQASKAAENGRIIGMLIGKRSPQAEGSDFVSGRF